MTDTSKRSTEKMIPVFVNHNQHVMARATIEQTAEVKAIDDEGRSYVKEPAQVVITVIAKGGHAQQLGDFVAMDEIVGLSFNAIPATPKKENS